jgi:hypothetical protein
MLAHHARRVGLCLLATALLALAAAAPVRADAVTDWNINATNALGAPPGQTPPVMTIHLAMVHGAVYDAVNSIDGRYEPYLVQIRAHRWYSQDAAAATAAYRVLVAVRPDQQPTLATLYAASLAKIPAGPAKDGGVAVGRIAAGSMLAAREDDGRFGPYRFPAPPNETAPWPVGQWRPTLPMFVNDPNAWVKDVRPFLIRDPDRYATDGPHPLTSRRYAREFNEVKLVGAATSAVRTADMTDAAQFWAGGPFPWTLLARQLSVEPLVTPAENARMFAKLYLTAADSLISCWTDKARWLFWRPITAIHQADRDGNPATAADPDWVPLINTPPYPDQPSGLTCAGGAMAGALAGFFGTDAIAFTVRSPASGTERSYDSFSQAVQEIVDARVWSGIHFRKADEDAAVIAHRIARFANRHYFRPEHRGWSPRYGDDMDD